MNDKKIYMQDSKEQLEDSISSRIDLYPDNLRDKWKEAIPEIITTEDGESILKILDHEVMSDYQLPYMQKLASIVTKNGGNILNIGFGLGIIDREIEKLRTTNALNKHYVIEINKEIAKEARKISQLNVLEGDWIEKIKTFDKEYFDGIIYDGYPLSFSEVHRDGILFIQKLVESEILKKNGVLTFFVDASESLGEEFLSYIEKLGLKCLTLEKVSICVPARDRPNWKADHFLAPTVIYAK